MPRYQERHKLPSVSEAAKPEVTSGKERPKTSGHGRDAVDSGEIVPLLDRPQEGQSAESELNGAVSTDTILTREGNSRSEKGKVCPF